MKNFITLSLCIISIGAFAQMQLDNKIQLTGTGGNAKIEGIDEIINNNDAANKIYVDTAIANRAGSSGCGPSNLNFSLLASTNAITMGKGTTNDDLQLFLNYISGNASAIQFEITGLPNGIIYDIDSRGTVFPSSSDVLFISNTSVSAGTYPLTITANCGQSPQSVNFTLTVDNSKRVFLTSTAYTGDFGGVAAGDNICQTLANSKGLGGTWMAWLADGNASSGPSSRFSTQSSDPYRLLDGTIIADNWSDLTDNTLDNNFTVDESGDVVTTNIRTWSNVTATGARFTTNEHCTNWTSSGTTGRTGVPDRPTNSDWTGDNTYSCNNSHRLYCFEQ